MTHNGLFGQSRWPKVFRDVFHILWVQLVAEHVSNGILMDHAWLTRLKLITGNVNEHHFKLIKLTMFCVWHYMFYSSILVSLRHNESFCLDKLTLIFYKGRFFLIVALFKSLQETDSLYATILMWYDKGSSKNLEFLNDHNSKHSRSINLK